MRNAIPTLLLAAAVISIPMTPAAAQTTAPSSADRIPNIDELPAFQLEPETPPPARRAVKYSLTAGAAGQFGGGNFDALRLNTGVSASMSLNSDIDLSLSFGYKYDKYDFDSDSIFGADAWDEIHTYGVRANFDIKINSDWTLFVGPVFQVSAESGAEFDESWIAGGFAGLVFRAEPGVVIGGGLGVVSQLQDKARIQPIIVLDWAVTSDIRLTSRSSAGATGVNLVFDISEKVDVFLGLSYIFKRFRLNDQGITPGGVGMETGLPVQIGATFTMSPTSTLTAYGGVVLGGEIKLENRDGGKMRSDNDAAALFGITASFRF